MENEIQQISSLLHQAAETHHVVFAISDGDDPDWASCYADWLVNLSTLPTVVESRPLGAVCLAAEDARERRENSSRCAR